MIDIIIVNWNAGEQLRDCIESVRRFGGGLVGKCVVVDNGSTDGSTDFLAGALDVDLVLTGRNLGFAAGCNLGAARGNSPFILLLNPDACLREGSLATPLSWMGAPENAGTGICGVQLRGDGETVQRSCARFPTPIGMLLKTSGVSAILRHTDFHMNDWDHSETRVVDHVIGAFYLTRRTLWQQLGGLDERFFVYLEDLDFSYRARQIGFVSVYLAEVQAWHKGGGVSEQVKAHRLFYSLRSRILYAFKHFSVPAAAIIAGTTLLVEPLSRLGLLALRGRWREIPDLGRGYLMLWRWAATRLVGQH